MFASNLFTAVAVVLSLTLSASAAPSPPSEVTPANNLLETRALNGLRGCAGGAISCEYPKGRCANLCEGVTVCYCPDGQDDNPYTGASCIDIVRWTGRAKCNT